MGAKPVGATRLPQKPELCEAKGKSADPEALSSRLSRAPGTAPANRHGPFLERIAAQ
jgi:hypothetical protein